MPEFTADFSQAKRFITLPKGTYDVHVAAAELTKSQSSNLPMLKVRLEVDAVVSLLEGAEFTEEECLGQGLLVNWMLAGEGAGITEQAFEALYGDAEKAPGSTEELVGGALRVKVTHRVYEESKGGDGSTRANVSTYEAMPGIADGGRKGLFSR